MRFCRVELKKHYHRRFFSPKTAMSSFFFIPLSADMSCFRERVSFCIL
ncbi:hypothetical protein HMPREF9999_01096 [Alloprevotella sp. oral taxon 473 str. F0040]|nr:hypothetical protein HMPREF9999_01096 [Alloprevotella sp. oral taxon 473 str. F0040]